LFDENGMTVLAGIGVDEDGGVGSSEAACAGYTAIDEIEWPGEPGSTVMGDPGNCKCASAMVRQRVKRLFNRRRNNLVAPVLRRCRAGAAGTGVCMRPDDDRTA
jgi:hypothetical protein